MHSYKLNEIQHIEQDNMHQHQMNMNQLKLS